MSVVFLSTGPPTVDTQKLRALAKSYNVTIPETEEPHYLHLLNGLDATASLIAALPAYTNPRLLPDPSTLPRNFEKLGGDATRNPLNCWSHKTRIECPDQNLINRRLNGKTLVVKDNVSIAGVPLTGGTFPELLTGKSEYPIPQIDAIVVKRVLESGATLLGSANCEHFSMSPLSFTSATGPVHNAWKRGYTTGGSSSGCAAAVACNAVKKWRTKHRLTPLDESEIGDGVDMAIGGDQGGSIRIPAAYAGIYGMKPTHGLVPYTGIISLIPMIDHAGPMTSSLADNMALLSTLSGWDGMDPRCTPETPLRQNVLDYAELVEVWRKEKEWEDEWSQDAGRGLRVGIIKESLEVMGLSEEVKRVFADAAEQFKAVGAEVKEVSIPMHTLGPAIWTMATRPYMVSHGLQNRVTPYLQYPMPDITPPALDQKTFDVLQKHNPAVVNMFFNSAFLDEKADANALLGKALTHVQELRDAYDVALQEFDVLLTPVNCRVGSKHPEYGMHVGDKMEPAIGATLNTCQFNVTGHPALSLPAGWGKCPDGPGMLPVGIQLVAKRFDELSIYKAATAWEAAGKGLDTWNGQLN
ncbi:amidase signature enzyme [Lophiostoma macrostomum CBS 122681]|uniref:Amidase signature enzyme n=1 Tax=Lophiostoma macrostomum CBS 122681 TaxID=1314788 RepID=A0A6A6TNX8_9PLEO|nr:amidase signature enzyme [Lophiostoma macrostomum CBS 122681]